MNSEYEPCTYDDALEFIEEIMKFKIEMWYELKFGIMIQNEDNSNLIEFIPGPSQMFGVAKIDHINSYNSSCVLMEDFKLNFINYYRTITGAKIFKKELSFGCEDIKPAKR